MPALEPPLRVLVTGYLQALAKIQAAELTSDGTGCVTKRLSRRAVPRRPPVDCLPSPEANPNGHRTVFISDYHAQLRAAWPSTPPPAGRALLAQRWRVEPTIAWLVRYQGWRRARRVGEAAAQCQLYPACAMRNLLLWRSRLRRGQAAAP
ncbi:MAG TPA: transposase [Roseiflexaceae bacterium]|nr:transposase [Roseiflexaceae bacterium]